MSAPANINRAAPASDDARARPVELTAMLVERDAMPVERDAMPVGRGATPVEREAMPGGFFGPRFGVSISRDQTAGNPKEPVRCR
jgi:hypothetical protein